MKLTLPTDSTERKNHPVLMGVLRYVPFAIMLMSKTSKDGNDKHNPGQPLHHARGKSTDHGDCVARHLMDLQDIEAAIERGAASPEALRAWCAEAGQFVWRAAMYVQEKGERYGLAPLAPGARLPEAPVPAGTADDVPVLFNYSHEIPPAPFGGVPYAELPPGTVVCGPAGADWRERGIARDEHGGTATVG